MTDANNDLGHSPDTTGGNTAWSTRSAWILFIVLSVFPLFMRLGVMPLRQWDESRQAISAYEMSRNGDWLVTRFQGEPDMWSTKPPLLIWCQAALFKVFGPDEVGVRLPSAVAAFLTGFLLMWVCARWLRQPWMGLAAALILFTSEGYINMHVARSGDYDAPMTFFMVLQAVALFRFSMTGSRRAVGFFFFALTAGILTKSVQSLLFLPGLITFLLITGSWRALFRQRTTWIGAAACVLVVASFYLARERMNPGYIEAVVNNELGDRYNTVVEGHRGAWDYYLNRFIRWNFTWFYLLVPMGMVLGLVLKDPLARRWGLMTTVCGIGYLVVISGSSTKCEWYDAPAYPMIAMASAFCLFAVHDWMRRTAPLKDVLSTNVLPVLFYFLVFATPYKLIVDKAYLNREFPWDVDFYAPSYYLKEALQGKRELKADVVTNDCYDAHLKFYMALLNDQGKKIRGLSKHDLRPGMRALAFEPYVIQVIERDYRVRVIDESGAVRVFEILGPAEATTDTTGSGQ